MLHWKTLVKMFAGKAIAAVTCSGALTPSSWGEVSSLVCGTLAFVDHCRVSFKRKPLEHEPLSLLFIKAI